MYFTLILDLSLSICQLQDCWTIAVTVSNVSGQRREEKKCQNACIRKLPALIYRILICYSKLFPSNNQIPVHRLVWEKPRKKCLPIYYQIPFLIYSYHLFPLMLPKLLFKALYILISFSLNPHLQLHMCSVRSFLQSLLSSLSFLPLF